MGGGGCEGDAGVAACLGDGGCGGVLGCESVRVSASSYLIPPNLRRATLSRASGCRTKDEILCTSKRKTRRCT